MSTTTIFTVIAMAIFFILVLVLEVMSTPTAREDENGNEYIPPLNKRQRQLQFASKLCFYGILGLIFTVVITAMESCNA